MQALDTVALQELKVNQVAAQQIIVESQTKARVELWTSYISDFLNIFKFENPPSRFAVAMNKHWNQLLTDNLHVVEF